MQQPFWILTELFMPQHIPLGPVITASMVSVPGCHREGKFLVLSTCSSLKGNTLQVTGFKVEKIHRKTMLFKHKAELKMERFLGF